MLFDAALVCSLTGIKRVYLGHEKSADFGNGATVLVDARGPVEINHQYDKSSAFLTLAADYVRSYIQPLVVIESRLCNMWELHIAKVFCREPILRPFHKLFLSCNEPLGDDLFARRHPTSIMLPSPPTATSTEDPITSSLLIPSPPKATTGFPLCLACEGYHTPRYTTPLTPISTQCINARGYLPPSLTFTPAPHRVPHTTSTSRDPTDRVQGKAWAQITRCTQ